VVTGIKKELEYTQREKGKLEVVLQALKEQVRELEDDKNYFKSS
jgi:hypothetical protein